MAEQPGKNAKIQVNGTSGSWTEIAVARDGAPDIENQLNSATAFGDEGEKRIAGVLDTSIEIEMLLEASPSAAVTDLRDSVLNGTAVDVEYSPDGNPSSPTDVYAFTTRVSSFSPSSSSGSEQTVSATCENSDGNKVSVSGTFS